MTSGTRCTSPLTTLALGVGLFAISCAGALKTGSDGGGSGGTEETGGSTGTGGSAGPGDSGTPGGGGGGGTGGTGSMSGDDCGSMPGLTWKTARKSWYTSYPEPGSEECITFSGCQYQGMFAACSGVKSKAWVMSHNIVAFFPLGNRQLHDICIKAEGKSMIVTVYDTCGDADCNGCCTKNKGDHDALVDLESFTNMRWGMEDGTIQWADLGPTKTGGCN